jgi:hypothetical protein
MQQEHHKRKRKRKRKRQQQQPQLQPQHKLQPLARIGAEDFKPLLKAAWLKALRLVSLVKVASLSTLFRKAKRQDSPPIICQASGVLVQFQVLQTADMQPLT